MTGATQVRRRLRLHPSSVGDARRTVRHALGQAGRSDLNDSAQLLVTELVTNAILHAGTHVDLSLSAAQTGLLVLVSDGSSQRPALFGPRRPSADTGRGLLLLDELSTAWGVMAHDQGKTVWFQLDDAIADNPDGLADGSSGAPETRTIQLLNLPVLLYRAWQHHAEALLREYLLTNLMTGPKDTVLRTHAAAGNAVALLARHVPREHGQEGTSSPRTDGDGEESGLRLALEVPLDRVADFDELADTLASAEATAQSVAGDRFSQHQLSCLTDWLCDQVARQSRAQPPTPWRGTDG